MISRNKQRKELIRMLYAMLDELEAKERHPNPGFPFNFIVDPIRWVLNGFESWVSSMVGAIEELVKPSMDWPRERSKSK